MNRRGQQNQKTSFTKEAFLPHNVASAEYIDNLYLQLYRYAHMEVNNKNNIKIKPYILNKDFQYRDFQYLNLAVYRSILSNLDTRIKKVWSALKFQDHPFIISQQSRWAIGIGGVSPYGNLLLPTLHPLYGIPYLPASTLKGLMRHCWIDVNCSGNEQDVEVLKLFGFSMDEISDDEFYSADGMGQLVFFDSYPDPNCKGKLVKDVFTPHYQDYYSSFGSTSPTDDQNPIPIEFLCIEDFRFKIYIGTHKELNDNEKNKLQNALIYVFSEQGIGAKTALGYGRGVSG